MRWKAEVGEKGARAWVCDAKDMTRQFSVAVWVVDMLVADHNKLMDLEETTPPEVARRWPSYSEIGYLLKNEYGFVSAHVPDLVALPHGQTPVFLRFCSFPDCKCPQDSGCAPSPLLEKP